MCGRSLTFRVGFYSERAAPSAGTSGDPIRVKIDQHRSRPTLRGSRLRTVRLEPAGKGEIALGKEGDDLTGQIVWLAIALKNKIRF
jgi:hypothetical protein